MDEKLSLDTPETGVGDQLLLVRAAVLPDVFQRVVEAKALLTSGEAANSSKAAEMAGMRAMEADAMTPLAVALTGLTIAWVYPCRTASR